MAVKTATTTAGIYYYSPSNSEHKTNFKTSYLNKNIINSASIFFNGLNRLKDKDFEYYQSAQCYQHFKKNTSNDGIYVYSFSLNPDEYQPSGSCNFTLIDKLDLQLNINELPKNNGNEYYKYNFNVYFSSYNVLRIISGRGGLNFAN